MADEQIPAVAESCKTCRFLGPPSRRNPHIFQCRRFPPTAALVVTDRKFSKNHYTGATEWSESLEDKSFWPMTGHVEWCGEWQTKVQQPPCVYCRDTGLSVRYDENRAVWADQPCPIGCPRRG